MKTFRLLSLLLLFLALIGQSALAAETKRLPLKLKICHALPDPQRPSPEEQAEVAVLNAFREKFPHINPVRFTGVKVESKQDTQSELLMAIAARMAPDVLYVNFRQSDTYIRQNFLYPLDEYVAEMSEEELDLRVPKPVWPVMKRKGLDGEEHIWAMPYAVLIRTMIYRKDLFHEVGLDPERGPRNWDELKEYVKRLTNPEKGTYGIGLYLSESEGAWDWITYLWSAGGKAVVQDENGEWRAAFDDDAAAEAMLFYMNLICERWTDARGKERKGYCFRGDYTQMNRLWDDGKIGLRMSYLNAKTIGGNADPNILGIMPVPFGPTNQRGSELNCMMFGIFSGIEPREGYTVEEIRRAAWEFIRFWDSEEAREIRTRAMVEAGMGKFMNPLYLKRFGYEEYLKQVNQEWVEAYETAVNYGQPEPYGKNCQMIYMFLTYPLNKVRQLAEENKLGRTKEEKLATIKEVLRDAVRRTNIEMIGHIEPSERSKRNMVAFVVAVLVIAGFILAVVRVWKIFTPEEAVRKGGWRFRRYMWCYIILLPALLSIFIWQYLPMLMGSLMVVQDYRVVGNSAYVGVQNFADVLWDPAWWRSLWVTLKYMILIFGLGFWPPIVLAILLHEVSHFKILYRTIYYLPAVLTGFVVIYLWKLFFDASDAGTLNQLLNMVGLPSLEWLKDDRLALLCCVIPTVWAGMGPGCLIYLAALKAVPDDLYEAADIDGAGFFGKIRHITLPTLKALIIIQFIATFITAAQSAGWILVMTGTKESTKVAGLHIWEKAYMFLRFGTAVTMAWILGVLLLTFTVQQLKILSRMEFHAAGSKE